MLKFLAILAMFCLLPATAALAKDKGGYTGPTQGAKAIKASEVENYPDDTQVILVGKLESHLKGDKYHFNDGTATIVVEIDDDEWNGLTVGPEEVVEIFGEIDKDFNGYEVEVKKITKK